MNISFDVITTLYGHYIWICCRYYTEKVPLFMDLAPLESISMRHSTNGGLK